MQKFAVIIEVTPADGKVEYVTAYIGPSREIAEQILAREIARGRVAAIYELTQNNA